MLLKSKDGETPFSDFGDVMRKDQPSDKDITFGKVKKVG